MYMVTRDSTPTLTPSSMRDYFNVISPNLSNSLVSSEALFRIREITSALPPFAIACLECRLAEHQPRVDFLVSIPHGSLSIPEQFLTHPCWQAIDEVYQSWSDSSSYLYKNVNNLCLEFDLERGNLISELVIPCLFFGLDDKAIHNVNHLSELLNHLPKTLLENYTISSKFQFNLEQCINKLPQQAFIAHLGIMLSRSTQQVRLHIKGIPATKIPQYLSRIGWKGDTDKIFGLIESMSGYVDYFTLDLDIGEQIGEQIGLECYLNVQPPQESRWNSFLAYLNANGLCSSQKKDALLAWPGITQKADVTDIWPNNLLMGDLFLSSVALSLFFRAIYHIKIVYHPDLPLSAKAYLEFGHRWVKNELISSTENFI